VLKVKNYKKFFIIYIGFIIVVNLIIPLSLEFTDYYTKISILSILGNFLIISTIIVSIVDILYLVFSKRNIIFLSFSTMTLCISQFLLLEYCFINDFFYFEYVWMYSADRLFILYKLVAIWAGQSGSILTWIVFNSLVIVFYRIKNFDKEDVIFLRSTIMLVFTSIVFLVILLFLTPFKI